MFTDHAAVKPMLVTPNPSGKHARWYMRLFVSGVKDMEIKYRSGKYCDALLRCPTGDALQVGIAEGEVQIASVTSQD